MHETIRLDVSKTTFTKYIVKAGFNYKILQYEDFIEAIRRNILNTLKAAIMEDNLKEVRLRIFGDEEVSIDIFFNFYIFTKFSLSYLKEIMEEGVLDSYFEEGENNIVFSEEIKEKAYTLNTLLNSQTKYTNFDSVLSHLNINHKKSSSEYIKIMKCINFNNFIVSPDKEQEILENINSYIKMQQLRNALYNYQSVADIIQISTKDIISVNYRNSEESLQKIISKYAPQNILENEVDLRIIYDIEEARSLQHEQSCLSSKFTIYRDELIPVISAVKHNDNTLFPVRFKSREVFSADLSVKENFLNITGQGNIPFTEYEYNKIKDLKVIDPSKTHIEINGILETVQDFIDTFK